jgi:hypothetical protein
MSSEKPLKGGWIDLDTGELTRPLPKDCVKDCSASGSVDEAVAYWRKKLNFTVPGARAVRYLRQFGAWRPEELNALPLNELAEKVLWLACCEINEEGEWFGLRF